MASGWGVVSGVIVGTDGLPVLLRGIVWGGYQSGTMVEGLQVNHSVSAGTAHCCDSWWYARWDPDNAWMLPGSV